MHDLTNPSRMALRLDILPTNYCTNIFSLRYSKTTAEGREFTGEDSS